MRGTCELRCITLIFGLTVVGTDLPSVQGREMGQAYWCSVTSDHVFFFFFLRESIALQSELCCGRLLQSRIMRGRCECLHASVFLCSWACVLRVRCLFALCKYTCGSVSV